MLRNILVQSTFQVILLLILLFSGTELFNVPKNSSCAKYDVAKSSVTKWVYDSNQKVPAGTGEISCLTFPQICSDKDQECFEDTHHTANGTVTFSDLKGFSDDCLNDCLKYDYTHGSLMFNTFVFCQVFNEYTSKEIHSEWDVFSTFFQNPIFLVVSFVTVALQIMLIEVGGEFIKTSPLNASQWLITIGLGALSLPIGVAMRFIPVEEDPTTFFDNSDSIEEAARKMRQRPGSITKRLSEKLLFKRASDEDDGVPFVQMAESSN
jgi:magnesium-transporting ATPase (P-type)